LIIIDGITNGISPSKNSRELKKINQSVDDYITDKIINIIKIIDDRFFDNHLLNVILSINVLLTESVFKFGKIIPLI
jgi:hypothetical protein